LSAAVRTRTPRAGFTILELLVVLAMLLLLAALTLPSFAGLRGNSKQKAASDIVRTRIANARTRAMETGVPHRLAISADGKKIRLGPDVPDFANLSASTLGNLNAAVNEDSLDADAGLQNDDGAANNEGTADGWKTIATFKPDGTCVEDHAIVTLQEEGFPPLRIQIRGITGTARILPVQTGTGAGP
jgi:prepilin-type N-terminal cleavage/methylation domain-containing protein